MQYCGKCRRVCGEGIEKCPGCRSRKLRPAGEGDEVFLCCADMYAAGRINGALIEAGIESRLESAGSAYFNFDSSSSPTDQNIYVPYGGLDKAGEIAAAVSREQAGGKADCLRGAVRGGVPGPYNAGGIRRRQLCGLAEGHARNGIGRRKLNGKGKSHA